MTAQIIPFTKIPRLIPAHKAARIDRARATLETCQFFMRCEEAARDAVDEGDIDEAIRQIVALARFQISDQAPDLSDERLVLIVDLVSYAADRAQGAAHPPSN